MRFCPVTLKNSPSETETLCVHISEAGYEKIKLAHVGTEKDLSDKVERIYAQFGRREAGPADVNVVRKFFRNQN
jgi:hypothetical protein